MTRYNANGHSMTSVAALADAGLVKPTAMAELERVAARYAVSITPAMAELIDPTSANDPIARQFVPTAAELVTTADESVDPIGDAVHAPVPGIVHRYPDRALLKLTGLCPVYCRFCFRRETVGPGADAMLPPEQLAAALAYICAAPALWEIILTGGDPLILSPRRIAAVTQQLAEIAHVKVLRWHSRVPVVAPERITPELVAALRARGAGPEGGLPGPAISGPTVYVGLHCNRLRPAG
jgi:lysine 2,3-aminomutase